MVSLWGTKDDNQDDGSDTVRATSSDSQQRQPEPVEVNERSRLIPRQERGGPGYLDPDDPAVCATKRI
jgi:hypothetical protein